MAATNWPRRLGSLRRPLVSSWAWICFSSFRDVRESIREIVGCFEMHLKELMISKQRRVLV